MIQIFDSMTELLESVPKENMTFEMCNAFVKAWGKIHGRWRRMSGSKKVFTTLGSSNHVPEEREAFDYYATDPRAVEMLLELEQFSPVIWEPACGEGHISKVLQAHGYEVISTDLIYRGFGDPEPLDFLKETLDDFEGDIITNPPYSMGLEFVQRALESVRPGGKVAMFLKVQFLEGQKRGEFFKRTPPPKGLYQPFPAGLL